MTRMLLAAAAALLLVPAWAGDAVRIGQEALLEKMTSGRGDLLLLDVRTAKEFAEGHVPGAVNIPHDELAARLPGLEAERGSDVVVYCRSGRRAEIALDLLAKAGFERLSHLEGDFQAWAAADRPVEMPTPPVQAPAAASPAVP
jgi:phage shock protein E